VRGDSSLTGATDRAAEEDGGLRGPVLRRPRLLALVPAALTILGLVGCVLLLAGSVVAWKLGYG